MTGLQHISDTFKRVREENHAALMPYFTLGFPTQELSLDILKAIADAGADLIELGIPFSDPLADGPTIQHSTQVALEQGMNTIRCLEMTAQLRARGVQQPLLLMGYINPILVYGTKRYVNDATQAGADGLIIPDLPPEEALEIETACREKQMALVYLAAPTSTQARLTRIAEQTSGFLYLVSLTGITGARQSLPTGLKAFVERARQVAKTPLAVGFGISTPDQARLVGQLADGVIVGSALIDRVTHVENPCQAAASFIQDLAQALSKQDITRQDEE
jgi:tryptophan synthase alpha chain